MRSLGGFVLLAGLGVGLFYYLPAPVDGSTTLEQAKRVLKQRNTALQTQAQEPAASPAVAPVSRLSGFAARVPLAAPNHQPQQIAKNLAKRDGPALKAAASVEPMAPLAGTSGPLTATDPNARYQLVTDIQRELKRVGCYWGRVNGAWNNTTRSAMRTFNDRSNSALPIEQPDYLLLASLKSHAGTNCGEIEQPASTVAEKAETLPWKTTTQSDQAATTPLFKPVPTSIVSTEPLPGRMSVGGPRDFPTTARAPLIPGDGGAGPSNATAALEPSSSSTSSPAASAPPKQRTTKKAKSRRVAPGTPRYNLMLSLGGVY